MSESHPAIDLPSLSLFAFRWNYFGYVARSAAGFVIGISLARLLGPKPFGQLAAVTLVFGLANLLVDGGVTSALVQANRLTAVEIRYAFTFQVLMGTTLTICAGLSGPFLAVAFHDPAIATIVLAAAPLFLLQSCGQTATGLLRRQLDFRSVQQAQVVSYFVGYVAVGIPAAVLGLGVWSLIAAQLSQAALYSSQMYARVRHPILPCFRANGAGLLRFGTKIVGTNIVNWGIGNLDNVFVGRAFGSTTLGLYSRAFNLAYAPAEGVVSTFQQVLFAACSRGHNRTASLRRAYLASVAAVAVMLFPPFWTAAWCAPAVVVGLLGAKWVGAAPLFRPLALAVTVHALMALSGPLLAATNHVKCELRAQSISLALAVTLFAASVKCSAEALAWAVLCVCMIRFYLVTVPVLRLLEIPWRTVGGVLCGPSLTAAVTAATVSTAAQVAGKMAIAPAGQLTLLALAGVVTAGAILYSAGHLVLPPELLQPLVRLSSQLPPPIARASRRFAARRRARAEYPLHPVVERLFAVEALGQNEPESHVGFQERSR